MLKSLTIENLGLVEKAHLIFDAGFTAITGETGSGKTSFIEALKLALGKKSDFEFIKNGATKAIITAVFEPNSSHAVYKALEEQGIELEPFESIIISRHLLIEGKSKAFINQQPISLHALSKISTHLCAFVDQNALLELKDPHFFKDLIDQTGSYKDLLHEYSSLYKKLTSLETELHTLEKMSFQKDMKLKFLEEDIDELQKCPLKDHEEAEIFESFKKTQSTLEKLGSFQQLLDLTNGQLLPVIKKIKGSKALQEHHLKLIEEAYVLICEFSMNIEEDFQSLDLSEELLTKLESKLKLIYSLKRRFNVESSEFSRLLEDKKKELETLSHLDFKLEELQKNHKSVFQALEQLSDKLTHERKTHAQKLEQKIITHLRELNMPYCDLRFDFSTSALTCDGQDKIDLLLKANSNTEMTSVTETASGGELARVNFCFFLIQDEKMISSTYFFDEIDASVGGVTSTLMADKLKNLAQTKQVFCITHFAQMAQKATHHLSFNKFQDAQNTSVEITYSQNKLNQEEIDRMIGVKE